MKRATEGGLKKEVKAMLQQYKSDWLWVYYPQDRFTAGIPDVLGVYCGKAFAVELKRPGGKQTALQRLVMEEMRKAGIAVAVVMEIDELEPFLSRLGICKTTGPAGRDSSNRATRPGNRR